MDRCCTPPRTAEEQRHGSREGRQDATPNLKEASSPSAELLLSCSNSSSSSGSTRSAQLDVGTTTPVRHASARKSSRRTPLTQESLAALSAVVDGSDTRARSEADKPHSVSHAHVVEWLAATPPDRSPVPHIHSDYRSDQPAVQLTQHTDKEEGMRSNGGYHAVTPRHPWGIFTAATHTPQQQQRRRGSVDGAGVAHSAPPPRASAVAAATSSTPPPRVALGPALPSTQQPPQQQRRSSPSSDQLIALRLVTLSGVTLRVEVDRRLALSGLADHVARHLHVRHAAVQLTHTRTGIVAVSGEEAATAAATTRGSARRLCDVPGLAPTDVFVVLLRPQTRTTATVAAAEALNSLRSSPTPPPTTNQNREERTPAMTAASGEKRLSPPSCSPDKSRRRLLSPHALDQRRHRSSSSSNGVGGSPAPLAPSLAAPPGRTSASAARRVSSAAAALAGEEKVQQEQQR